MIHLVIFYDNKYRYYLKGKLFTCNQYKYGIIA